MYIRRRFGLLSVIVESIVVLTLFNVEKRLPTITFVAGAIKIIFTHLFPMYPFSTILSLFFSGGRERVYWERMG